MNYMFPYYLVEKGSKIILYGEGKVGKEFYLQLHQNKYCTVEAWVDKAFDFYETAVPFDKVKNITSHEFDYVVIALADMNIADKVKEDLMEMGIEKDKIVWSRFYLINSNVFPDNRELYLKNWSEYVNILDSYLETTEWFGGSTWYQGSPEIGVIGARKNGERIARYHVNEFLNKGSKVLDIGCNCGFFDIELAKWVEFVTGIDIESKYIDIANKARKLINIENVSFICGNFMDINETYDAVFSLGVHNYIFDAGISKEEYVSKLMSLTKKEGYIFIESHGMSSDGNQFIELCDILKKHGAKETYRVHSNEDGNRNMVIFRNE